MYVIVEFETDHSVQLVPASWLSANRKLCYWPPDAFGITTKIKKNEPPKDNWITYPIRRVLSKSISKFITLIATLTIRSKNYSFLLIEALKGS